MKTKSASATPKAPRTPINDTIIRCIIEAGGIASAGAGYSPNANDLHLETILPKGADSQLVTDLRAADWHVTLTPTNEVLR